MPGWKNAKQKMYLIVNYRYFTIYQKSGKQVPQDKARTLPTVPSHNMQPAEQQKRI
jgi:hypothetical protein